MQKQKINLTNDHSLLAPELSDNIHQVFPFSVNLFDPEFTRSLTPNFCNFSVSKSIYPQFY